MRQLFALTLLLGAALLFCVQPMMARTVLPLMGGTPAVWNTCMVFFQAALLAGYAYAHVTTTLLGVRRQAALHAAVLLLPLLALPVGAAAGAPPPATAGAGPTAWLLGWLLRAVGLPFFVVATTAPLLQRWFAATGRPGSADPYSLYAASNAGSLLALVAYPLAIEPTLRLSDQARAWSAGYLALVALTLACAAAARRSAKPEAVAGPGVAAGRPTAARRLRWLALAAVPSSLMLGVTTYLTTELMPMPLLWVAPLALYLLSFVLTFARRPPLPHAAMSALLPLAALASAWLLFRGPLDAGRYVAVPLLTLFLAAMVCHGELARDRPDPRDLTEFYLWLSVGGVAGGAFNALIAPRAFDRLAEYPLMIVLACLLRPAPRPGASDRWARRLDLALPLALGAAAAAYFLGDRRARSYDPQVLKAYALLLAACLAFVRRPLRFGLALGAVLVVNGLGPDGYGRELYRSRNFYGILRVADEAGGRFRHLLHGTTLHGRQALDPALRRVPTSYYHRSGPFRQIYDEFRWGRGRRRVAVVGLGVGGLAAYAEPGQRWTFYEIDPAVARVARDPRLFTYLADSPAPVDVVLGDARLRLREAPDGEYGLIAVDAFTSDSIPTHLLTREAMKVYLAKLAPGGLLAFHISNKFLDLRPVLGALARDAGLDCRYRADAGEFAEPGRDPAEWVVMAAPGTGLGVLERDPRWPRPPAAATPWTDDYSDLLRIFRAY